MIDIKTALGQKLPSFFETFPQWFTSVCVFLLRKLLCESDINSFLTKHSRLEDFDFIDAALDELSFTYKTNNKALERIPSSGRAIIIANHPLGALDALSLIKLVGEVRKDVKVVANDILLSIPNLKNLILGLDITTKSSLKSDMKSIVEHLSNDGALIIFPAGEVSRVRPSGIKDTAWESGALYLSEKTASPITPVYINAKNSWIFYTISSIYKPLAMFLLPREMFAQRGKSLEFVVGESIPAEYVSSLKINKSAKLKLLKKHLYLVGKNKKGIFETQKTIARAVDKKEIRDEIYSGELLGQTSDGKLIYLCYFEKNTSLLKELGRLRELSFRKVGEGTGASRDIDNYDLYYSHIILWDENNLEIVGSYRIGEGHIIHEIFGTEGFYTSSLFDFSPNMESILPHSIELGRSFVQPKYWGTRALDYLWHGIGAYLVRHPEVRYMFGPVSISGSYNDAAAKAIVFVYSKHFPSASLTAVSKNPLTFGMSELEELECVFAGQDYAEDFKTLKRYLKNFGLTVPTLYKQYSELCDAGGVGFADFGVDEDFGSCIDGLIVVETAKISLAKKQRYMGEPELEKAA
jgi:putative hemolysin